MSLLTNTDPKPYDFINPSGEAPILLSCEHAGRAVPQKLNTLGMDEKDYDQHYAYDPGVKEATHLLAEQLDAPAILGNYSRMVVDLGRRKDLAAFPTMSDNKPIIGNLNMTQADKNARYEEIYDPFNNRFEELLDDHFIADGILPMVISIHSFTPVFHGEKRPWEISFLWAQDPRLPHPLIKGMRDQGYIVGDNEPYDMRVIRCATINRYADPRGLPNVMVEFRNDLLRNEKDIIKHVTALSNVIKPLIGNASIHARYDGPQKPYDPELEKRYFAEVMRTVNPTELCTDK
jgi:predicted N-formylglutamate amidohydrolase